jgi:hypothetical protein
VLVFTLVLVVSTVLMLVLVVAVVLVMVVVFSSCFPPFFSCPFHLPSWLLSCGLLRAR